MNKNLHKFKGIAAVEEMYELQGCIKNPEEGKGRK